MPINDPGGHYASGGAVNQGGPVGPSGSSGGGSNYGPAYSGSRAYQPGGFMRFGWQPDNSIGTLQQSPDVWHAYSNPNAINYTDTPRTSGGTLTGGVVGLGGWNNPKGAAGANSGQGGMGAGRRQMLARALSGPVGSGGGGVRMG